MSSNSASISKIQNYALVGDSRSAALISNHGSIDWLAWPRFDSASFFNVLLDSDIGGHWSIAPSEPFTVERAYVRDANVLQTCFFCKTGQATLTDLMAVLSEESKRQTLWPDHELIRELVCTEGEMEISIDFCPRVEYGAQPVCIREIGALGLRMEVGRGAYWLRCNIPLTIKEDRAQTVVMLRQGERIQFSLTYSSESPAVLPLLGDKLSSRIEQSVNWWQQWAARCSYDGPYRESVIRSALTLKLLTYAPSGAITAAPTTSLPEIVGDSLNWDYRYCWLRDASLTVRALLGLGYIEETTSFLTWLLHTTRMTQPQLRVMYTVFGENVPREKALDHLAGYADSRPVRIGNGAREQLQLDIYGEVIDAAAQYARLAGSFDRTTQRVLIGLGKYVAQNWDQPDEGIWEPRSGRQNNTHSRLMCWTALDRLLEMDRKGILKGVPTDLFARERCRIHSQLCERAWNAKIQSYSNTLDGDSVDATLLRIPWYGFEPADSERMRGTYARVRQDLGVGDHLLFRYRREPPEGAFGICGFWDAEYLAIGGGTAQDAHNCFKRLLHDQNDVGLFSEEIDPHSGDALGNFPQAFTHLGLISAALSIQERERGEAHPAQQSHIHGKTPTGGARR